MVRPKSGTKAGDKCTAKPHETMIKKYGSIEAWKEHLRTIGSKGGQNGKGPDYKGGFRASHERAVSAGRKGGHISSRQAENKPTLEERRQWYEEDIEAGRIHE